MFAMHGILLALIARARTGRGQQVDVAMLDATAALLLYQASIYFTTGEPQRRMGNRHPSIAPYGKMFDAADGEFVLAVGHDAKFARLCAIPRGLDALARDPRFTTNAGRVRHYARTAAPARCCLPWANPRRLDRHADPGRGARRIEA